MTQPLQGDNSTLRPRRTLWQVFNSGKSLEEHLRDAIAGDPGKGDKELLKEMWGVTLPNATYNRPSQN